MLGYIDAFGNFILNISANETIQIEYNMFEKHAVGERYKTEIKAKVEAYKHVQGIIETEALKYEFYNMYIETMYQILNWRKETYNP